MATEKRLIDAVRFRETLDRYANAPHVTLLNTHSRCMRMAIETCMELLDMQRAVDVVSRGVHDQVRWERDVAIEQLEEHGIPFGGIAPDVVKVVRCKECKHRGEEGCCPMYFVDEIEWDDDGYTEVDYVPHDYTVDDGFCDRGERRTDNG